MDSCIRPRRTLKTYTANYNTPPISPIVHVLVPATPWSFKTGSFADVSEHRKQVDYVLREELLPILRIDIPDFISAVFGHIPRLDELAETVFDRCQEEKTQLYTKGSGWTEWPPSAKEDLVLEWLQDLIKRFMAWTSSVHPAASRQIFKGPSTYLDGSPIKVRKMDVDVSIFFLVFWRPKGDGSAAALSCQNTEGVVTAPPNARNQGLTPSAVTGISADPSIELLSRGLTLDGRAVNINREVAASLFLSSHTYSFSLSQVEPSLALFTNLIPAGFPSPGEAGFTYSPLLRSLSLLLPRRLRS
ncbi:MAG: hypothetical protein L6R38_000539 [Xanthoria sp. 2 TBL-2021]|nr:MAG: hypothetical protein L6R38_000539 [Xanthoria sp. 2 TBL-2021]